MYPVWAREYLPVRCTQTGRTRNNECRSKVFYHFLLTDSLSIPDSLPILSREQLAQTLIDGGYPELQSKGPRARQIWFQSYLQGRLFKDFESVYIVPGIF